MMGTMVVFRVYESGLVEGSLTPITHKIYFLEGDEDFEYEEDEFFEFKDIESKE
jgi:hypothetical protein